jgi:hypothetical protein
LIFIIKNEKLVRVELEFIIVARPRLAELLVGVFGLHFKAHKVLGDVFRGPGIGVGLSVSETEGLGLMLGGLALLRVCRNATVRELICSEVGARGYRVR